MITSLFLLVGKNVKRYLERKREFIEKSIFDAEKIKIDSIKVLDSIENKYQNLENDMNNTLRNAKIEVDEILNHSKEETELMIERRKSQYQKNLLEMEINAVNKFKTMILSEIFTSMKDFLNSNKNK